MTSLIVSASAKPDSADVSVISPSFDIPSCVAAESASIAPFESEASLAPASSTTVTSKFSVCVAEAASSVFHLAVSNRFILKMPLSINTTTTVNTRAPRQAITRNKNANAFVSFFRRRFFLLDTISAFAVVFISFFILDLLFGFPFEFPAFSFITNLNRLEFPPN